jgi:hypothetical protein
MPEAAFVCLTYYLNAEAKRLHVRVVDAEATKGAHVACLILGGMRIWKSLHLWELSVLYCTAG